MVLATPRGPGVGGMGTGCGRGGGRVWAGWDRGGVYESWVGGVWCVMSRAAA